MLNIWRCGSLNFSITKKLEIWSCGRYFIQVRGAKFLILYRISKVWKVCHILSKSQFLETIDMVMRTPLHCLALWQVTRHSPRWLLASLSFPYHNWVNILSYPNIISAPKAAFQYFFFFFVRGNSRRRGLNFFTDYNFFCSLFQYQEAIVMW